MSNSKAIHLTGLNGLRAIAALSVVIGHTFQDTFGVISNFACTIFGKVKCTFFGNVKCTL